jgi:membrane fusion protein (multidrug efflux system)
MRGRLGIAAVTGVAILTIVTLGGCAAADGGAAQAEEVEGEAPDTAGVRVINVGVTPVRRSGFVDYIRIVGEVEAMHDITVSAEETGPIAAFHKAKGARVARGAVLAKIDDAVLRGQVDEARATAELADEQFERQRRLWEEEQIGSEIAYLQARSAAQAADARYRTLLARLKRTEVRAPVTGIFDEKYVEIGEMVSPGSPIVRIVAIRQVKVVGGVPERFGLDVRQDDTARVSFDVLPEREFLGTIRFVGAAVDPENRTIPIEIHLDNPGGLIKPSMVANVRVERARLSDVVVVPQELLQRTEDGYQVFLVGDRDGRPVAVARGVETGPSFENRIVIRSGLEVGEPLITTGYRMVDDGSLVRVVSEGEDE